MKHLAFAAAIAVASSVYGQTRDVTLAWEPSTSLRIEGYRLYMGTAEGQYTQRFEVGLNLFYTVTGLQPGHYWFTVTAVSARHIESAPCPPAKVVILATPAPNNR